MADPDRVYRFGGFEYATREGELSKAGVRVRLSGQSAAALKLLAERAGETVKREELIAALWGPSVHVDDVEDGLNHAIKRLRDALGDDVHAPRYVERVPGVGYRLIAGLKAGPTPIARPAPPARTARGWPAAGLAVGVASVVLVTLAPDRELPAPAELEAPPVVAVLPFAAHTTSAEDAAFAEGIADALTNELAKISALRVISRTSTLRFRRSALPVFEIAQRLGASHLITGSVLRLGNDVRVTARLIDAVKDRHVWSTNFEAPDGRATGLFADAPAEIAAAVRVRLTPDEETRLAQARPVRPDVYEKYSAARQGYEAGDLDRAIGLFEEAVELDPDYAPAYSWLADAYATVGFWAGAPGPWLDRAETAALRAQSLDSTLAEPHLLRGRLLAHFEWKWREAERHYQRALELNPNHAHAYAAYAQYLAVVNRLGEATVMADRAVQLDPLSASTNALAGEVHHLARDYPRATELLLTAAALHPEGVTYHVMLGCLYGASGDFDQALTHLQQASSASNGDLRAQAIEAWIYARAGEEERAKRLLEGLESRWESQHNSHYTRAFVHIALGDPARALDLLDRAVEEKWPFLATVMSLPPYDPIRDDPRFLAIQDRMGLLELRQGNSKSRVELAFTRRRDGLN